MTFEETWAQAETITGYLFKEEGQALWDMTMQVPENGVIVELGCFCGRSSRIIVEAAKERKAKLYSVDSFVPHFDGVPTDPEYAIKSFHDNVLNPFYDYAELIKKDTSEASRYFSHEVDFIFMDADHSYEGVKKDCQAWLPKLESGGTIAFHDYNDGNWPEVKQAADEFISGWHNVRNDCSIAVFRKP